MPQIAQQDNIYIEIPQGESIVDVLDGRVTELHRRGVLFDVIIFIAEERNFARIVSYHVDENNDVDNLTLIIGGGFLFVEF